MNLNKVGDFLKSLRKAKGLTQQEVADSLYVTQKTISRWENGEGVPDLSIIDSVASFYDVTIDELLNGERSNLNLSEKTIKLKENEKAKLINNKIRKNLNIYLLISLILGGVALVTSFILYLFLDKYRLSIIGLILLVSLITSLIIYLCGSCHNRTVIEEVDLSLDLNTKNKVVRTYTKKNLLFSDLFILIALLGYILFGYLYVSEYYNQDSFYIMFYNFFGIGFIKVDTLIYNSQMPWLFLAISSILILVIYGVLRGLIKNYSLDKSYLLNKLVLLTGILGIAVSILSFTVINNEIMHYAITVIFLNNPNFLYGALGLILIIAAIILDVLCIKRKNIIGLAGTIILGIAGNYSMAISNYEDTRAISLIFIILLPIIIALAVYSYILKIKLTKKED